ncbi:MAG: hypothetical protein BWK77_06925 [Verrucomicrobia bacterium A1]|nr:MAG: hypothetical protein BWK77_06925 [Verrucomicrobia bacterium A1]
MTDWLRENRLRALGLVAGGSLAVQLLYLFESRRDPTFNRPIVDAQTYDQQARDFAAGKAAPRVPFWQPPLYPYALGLVYAATSDSIFAAKLVQSMLGVATCLLTVLVARRLFSGGVAVAAGLITALYGPLVFYNAQLLPAGLAALLILAAFLLFLRALDAPTPGRWLRCGVVAGLAALTVANAIVLVLLAAVWVVFRGPRRGSVLLLLGAVIAVAPVTIRNYLVAGEFVPISTNAGINLFIGNNENAWQTMAIRPGTDWSDLERMPLRDGVRSASVASAYFMKKVARYAVAHPGDFARDLLRKTRWFVNARELPRNTDLYVHASYSRALRALAWRAGPFAFPFGVVAPLALLGLVTACRRGNPAPRLAAGFVILYSLSVILFFVASRYRVVLAPFFAMFAAGGAAWLWTQRKSPRALALGIVVVAVGVAAANTTVRVPTDGVNFAAETHLFLGVRAAEEGDVALAAAEYAKALELEPGYPEAYNCIGNLRRAQGEAGAAIEAYTKAVTLNPEYAEAHNNLGLVLADRGRLDEAMEQFETAIRIRPRLAKPYHNLGLVRIQFGQAAAAVEPFRQSIRLDPLYFEALNDLAWLLAAHPDATVRNGAEAVEFAERLCRAAPELTPGMLDTLAAAYAEVGRFDAAASEAGRAVKMAEADRQWDWAMKVRGRVAEYQAGRPCRDASLAGKAAGP